VRLSAEGQAQREAGDDLMSGENGFLTRPQSVEAVAEAMRRCLRNRREICAMGSASRVLAEEVFDVRIVNDIILRAMGLTGTGPGRAAAHFNPTPLAIPLTHGL